MAQCPVTVMTPAPFWGEGSEFCVSGKGRSNLVLEYNKKTAFLGEGYNLMYGILFLMGSGFDTNRKIIRLCVKSAFELQEESP